MLALTLISIIIALCLFYVIRELQKQMPRNTNRRFGI